MLNVDADMARPQGKAKTVTKRTSEMWIVFSNTSYLVAIAWSIALTSNSSVAAPNMRALTVSQLSVGPNGRPADFDKPIVLDQSLVLAGALNHCSRNQFPEQYVWESPARKTQDLPADYGDGTPLIKQIRNGKVVATYKNLGGNGSWSPEKTSETPSLGAVNGALKRTPHRSWLPGDIFEVYPAVYEDESQQLWLGSMFDTAADYQSKNFVPPTNIVIRGITVNGKRPLIRLGKGVNAGNNTLGQSLIYFDGGKDITFENFDIQGRPGSFQAGKAAIYIIGVENLTLRNLRISGFRGANANGIFAAGPMRGTLRLDNIELFDNGGNSSPEHNIYINQSTVDPKFTAHITNSWSHSAYYGHTFKSRAQRNVIEGNYFMGAKAGATQAEAYLVNIPDGGELIMRNNILAKNYSGTNSNGASITYGDEKLVDDSRSASVLIEHNTFVGFTKAYDILGHPVYPMSFFYPNRLPSDRDFGVSNFSVRNNLFVGYCQTSARSGNFRGDLSLTAGFGDVSPSFELKKKYFASTKSIIGSPTYSHSGVAMKRQLPTVGARD